MTPHNDPKAAPNRIIAISSLPDAGKRREAYSRLLGTLAMKSDSPFDAGEVSDLAQQLQREADSVVQNYLWRLIVGAPPRPDVRDFALQCLHNLTCANRGEAFLYIRVHFPELLPELVRVYGGDHDPGVRYQITEYVADKNPSLGVDMKIDLLPLVESHELYDALAMEISQLGTRQHMERLNQFDKARGGGTYFHDLAEAIRERISLN